LSGSHIRPTKQVLPAVDAWNATVQHQLTNTIALEVAYVGSKGTHGFAGDGPNYDINPAAWGPGTDLVVLDPKTGLHKYAGFSPFLPQNNRRPLYPTIPFDLGNYYGNDAASTYNAFEIKVDKRFARGLQFLSHYTYSHADNYTDEGDYAISHAVAWGPVNSNRNHVFVANVIYELPFGRGKTYLGDVSKAMDYVVGGWQLSNTTNWSSGLPWTPSIGECGSVKDTGPCRPQKGQGTLHLGVGPLDPVAHTRTYFTPVAPLAYPDPSTLPLGTDACSLARPISGPFGLPDCGQIGDLGRNSYVGPRGFYSDLSVSKLFPITERFRAKFIMNAYNVFNHPVFAFSANNGANTCVDCSGGNNGKITGLEFGSSMRQLEFAVRFEF
jgi:hypothetical protein